MLLGVVQEKGINLDFIFRSDTWCRKKALDALKEEDIIRQLLFCELRDAENSDGQILTRRYRKPQGTWVTHAYLIYGSQIPAENAHAFEKLKTPEEQPEINNIREEKFLQGPDFYGLHKFIEQFRELRINAGAVGLNNYE